AVDDDVLDWRMRLRADALDRLTEVARLVQRRGDDRDEGLRHAAEGSRAMFGLSDVRSARGAPPRGHDATGREAPTFPCAARGTAWPAARRSPRPILRGPTSARRWVGAHPYGGGAPARADDDGRHTPSRPSSFSPAGLRRRDASRGASPRPRRPRR